MIRLEAAHASGAVRFLSGFSVTLEDGKKTSWVTLTRTGRFADPRYGEFEISREMLLAMVANFDRRTYGQDIFIDVSHRASDGAAAKVLRLEVQGDRLRALVEWTPYGLEAVRGKGYKYLSAEYTEDYFDAEKRTRHGPLLLGAGLTIRPVIKRLDPIELAEDDAPPTLIHPELRTQFLQETTIMWKKLIEALVASLTAKKLSEAARKEFADQAEKALAGIADEPTAKRIVDAFEAAAVKLAEQSQAEPVAVKIDLTGITPAAGAKALSEDDVKRVMAEEAKRLAEEASTAASTLAGKKKILADALAAVKEFDDELRRSLSEAVADLITPTLTDEQVQKLAAAQVATGNQLLAARKLSQLGFTRAGSPHITVDESNTVKKLQEEVDKRLGFATMPEARRFDRVGGKLPDINKQVAEKVLAQFDEIHGKRLHEEAKSLASGDSVVSDVAVPASFERTVIREALYNLVGLSLVNVDTAPFAAVVQLPYSYRDTGAAGISAVRKYEGGAIARAAVKQALHESRPVPQKLAFEVSDELRYLAGNGVINFDILGENARNASRIIGEDTEQLIFDEHLNAADQYSTVAVANEAVASGDGAKSIFVLNNFPVVRPKKVYDLQGNQVGSTLYPITITVNAVPVVEYTGGQAPGMYYRMNHNLGEIAFVTEAGAPQAVTNLHAIVCSYTYTTNVVKWDSDLGALAVDAKWDDFLYQFGLRKEVIESDRHYMANLAVMSGVLRTQIERAKQFSGQPYGPKPGNNLTAEGNLGAIKGVPSFKSTAPGLAIGDVRCVIGERETVRFRMLKPWAMGALENQKDNNGRFTGKKEAYGDQFVIVDTPTPLKAALTSVVVYSAAARIDR